MKFEDLAKKVAETFKAMMEEDGFESFKEMRKSYMWEADDIRDEICYSVKECGGDCYDDLSTIMIGWEEMAYGTFKKLVLSHLV